MAKVRQWFVKMLVLCGTATCTPTKLHTNIERGASTSNTPQTLDVVATQASTEASTDVTTTNPLPAEVAAEFDIRRAFLAHDYASANALLDAPPPYLKPATVTLLRGFLELHNAQPLLAIERFEQLGKDFDELKPWIDGLRAEALARAPSYVEHLTEITARAPFRRLIAVSERLLADKLFDRAERVLALAQTKSLGDHQNGQLRWLRARSRLAAGRAASAHADVRWLAITHPDHQHSGAAMAAIARGEYQSLSATEFLTRAQAAAERGLVDVVEHSLNAALAAGSVRLPEGERAYLRGLALYRARRFDEAIAPLDEAVSALASRRDRARYLAALATSRSGSGQGAVTRFTAIAAQKPVTENVENAAFLLGREQSLLGNWTSASEHHTQFLNQFPNHELAQPAHRERLIAWFAEGNYKRFIYWVRQFRQRYPDAKETLLLRSLEALALYRLGHRDLARPVWEDLARAAPLSFVGIAARQHLLDLGVVVASPVTRASATETSKVVSLPEVVEQLELAGLSEQSELVFRSLEPAMVRTHVPHESVALCEASGQLERGRRRFELGRMFADKRGLKDAPQLAPSWLWPCLFPSPHRDSVKQHAATHHVAPALIYAVMRQESAFQVDALSTASAHGLMQIIEPTARRIAAELGRPYDPEHLAIAHHNIEYGAFYIGKLQSHFRHPALVASAYNAGPDAAARWYAAGRTLPLEAFIARIPYDETRAYVQRVLENLVVYQTLLGSEAPNPIALEFATPLGDAALPQEVMHRAPDGFY